MSAGYFHSLALTSGGFVWVWGDDEYGELGDGTTTNDTVALGPVERSDRPARDHQSGYRLGFEPGSGLGRHRVGVGGEGEDGELGNGSTANSDKPVQVAGLTGVVQDSGL